MPLLHSAADADQLCSFLKLGTRRDVVDIGAYLAQCGVASNKVHYLGGDCSVGISQGVHELIQ